MEYKCKIEHIQSQIGRGLIAECACGKEFKVHGKKKLSRSWKNVDCPKCLKLAPSKAKDAGYTC